MFYCLCAINSETRGSLKQKKALCVVQLLFEWHYLAPDYVWHHTYILWYQISGFSLEILHTCDIYPLTHSTIFHTI